MLQLGLYGCTLRRWTMSKSRPARLGHPQSHPRSYWPPLLLFPNGWPDGNRLGSTPITPLGPPDGARLNSLRLPARLHNPLFHLQSLSTNKTPIILPKPSSSTILMSQMPTDRQQHTHLSLSELSYADWTFRHSNTKQTEFEFHFSFFCCSF